MLHKLLIPQSTLRWNNNALSTRELYNWMCLRVYHLISLPQCPQEKYRPGTHIPLSSKQKQMQSKRWAPGPSYQHAKRAILWVFYITATWTQNGFLYQFYISYLYTNLFQKKSKCRIFSSCKIRKAWFSNVNIDTNKKDGLPWHTLVMSA